MYKCRLSVICLSSHNLRDNIPDCPLNDDEHLYNLDWDFQATCPMNCSCFSKPGHFMLTFATMKHHAPHDNLLHIDHACSNTGIDLDDSHCGCSYPPKGNHTWKL